MKKQPKIDISRYEISTTNIKSKKIIIISDTHSESCMYLKEIIEKEAPDCMLVVGDIIDGAPPKDNWRPILSCLNTLSKYTPIYASLGNHETICADIPSLTKFFEANDIKLLKDEYAQIDDLYLYGFTPWHKTPVILPKKTDDDKNTILMCHSPSDYFNYKLNEYDYLLTISGHAHGGQWRLFGRGLFAPGQGLFPKYTNGFHNNGKLLITRGLANRKIVPRINNRPEVVLLSITNPNEK